MRRHKAQILCCVLPGFLLTTTAAAQDTPRQYADKGVALLQSNKFAEARKLFTLGIEAAATDNEWQARLHFYRGLAYQQEADSGATDPKDKPALLKRAVGDYEAAAKLRPKSGAILNNLGYVYAELGVNDRAQQAYQNAIELNDAHQATYLVNYAKFLEKTGAFPKAQNFFGLALELDPAREEAFTGLIRCAKAGPPAKFGETLETLFDQGEVPRVLRAALDELEDDRSRQKPVAMLLLVVRCLAAQTYDVGTFADSDTARRLKRAEGIHHQLSEPIREILLLHRIASGKKPPWDRDQFKWWSSKLPPADNRAAVTPVGGWPIEAFCALIRSCGEWYDRQGNSDTAEAYYELGFQLNERHLDPKAVTKLADLWLRTGQMKRLDDFISREQADLFAGKNDAIQNMQYERMFEFHKALGVIFWHLEKRGRNRRGPESSEFQLEHAIEAAREFNNRVADPSERIVEPRVVNLLAQRYEMENNASRAFQLRVEAGEYFNQIGATGAAAEVIQPITAIPTGADRSLVQQYQALQAVDKPPLRPVGWNNWNDFDFVSQADISLAQGNGRTKTCKLTYTLPKGQQLTARQIQELTGQVQLLYESQEREHKGVHLLGEGYSPSLLRADLQGDRGRLEFDFNSKPVEVIFRIDYADTPTKGNEVRFVRP